MPDGNPIELARVQLQAARDSIQAEIDKLQADAAQLDIALAALPGAAPPPAPRRRRGRQPAQAAQPAQTAAADKTPPTNGRRRRAAQSRPGTISAAIEDFLDSNHPRALHASDILDHLAAEGSTPGGNARNVLQSTLNRLQDRGSVKNIGRNRWRRIRPRGRQPAAEAQAEAAAAESDASASDPASNGESA